MEKKFNFKKSIIIQLIVSFTLYVSAFVLSDLIFKNNLELPHTFINGATLLLLTISLAYRNGYIPKRIPTYALYFSNFVFGGLFHITMSIYKPENILKDFIHLTLFSTILILACSFLRFKTTLFLNNREQGLPEGTTKSFTIVCILIKLLIILIPQSDIIAMVLTMSQIALLLVCMLEDISNLINNKDNIKCKSELSYYILIISLTYVII